jgi:3-deoxy-D-manno-octulosonic-acid transferase
MRAAGALRVGADAGAVASGLEELLASPELRDAMVAAGLALVEEGRGALERTLALVAADLPPPP